MKKLSTEQEEKIRSKMKPGKEYSTAQVGDMLWGGSPSELHWQKYALPAGKLLKRAKEQGIVTGRYDHGSGFGRTLWKIKPRNNGKEEKKES